MSTLLVVILVAVGEANHPATLGAASAAREILGAERDVLVREMEGVPNDDRALSLAASLHASTVVELSWDIPEHRQAAIRVHLDRRPGWSDRLIVFDRGDDIAERGRTVGYALASMTTAAASEPLGAAGVPPSRPEPFGAVTASPAYRPDSAGVPVVPQENASKVRIRGAVDALAAGAVGVDGPAGGWGGSLSGRFYFAGPFAARVGASLRSGQVAPAQSQSLLFHLAAGVAWLPIAPSRSSPFELGARLDALLLREQLTHFDSDDVEPVTAMRWLPGVDAAVEGGWLFSPNAAVLASFGPEVAFGQTDVTLHQQRVTSIPPLRLVFQAGVRATF